MKVQLEFGRCGVEVALPAAVHVEVVQGKRLAALSAPQLAVRQALLEPIASVPLPELARGRGRCVVVVSDKTRPVPYPAVLPPLLELLRDCGLGPDRVEILVATGLHRPNDPRELEEMLGPEITRSYRIRNHVARDDASHAFVGTTNRGTEVWIDRGYLEADLRILTGLIEPHLMAGYSGGRKALCPGLASVKTIRSVHGPGMLEGRVGPGILEGNPFHEELVEILEKVGADFLFDVTVDRQRRLTGVFAGDPVWAHQQGALAVERQVLVSVEKPADIVLVSAGGYPLDQTLYQAIKGLAAALNVVRPDGAIVLVAELSEGAGSREFVTLLRSVDSPEMFMERVWQPDFFSVDQWMVQHLCQVLRKASVWIATPRQVVRFGPGFAVRWAESAEQALDEALQQVGAGQKEGEARLVVIPDGPYTLATVLGRKFALGTAWCEAA